MKQEVRNEAHFVSVGFNLNGEKIFSELADQNFSSRITWIASDGTVLFDSSADPGSMENHLDRPEISDALNNGSGEAVHLPEPLVPRLSIMLYVFRTALLSEFQRG